LVGPGEVDRDHAPRCEDEVGTDDSAFQNGISAGNPYVLAYHYFGIRVGDDLISNDNGMKALIYKRNFSGD